jgi:hypothetical protein
MKNATEYLEAGGSFCPFCRASDITGGSMDFDSGSIEQKITCEVCGKVWFDVYRLVGVEES